MRALGIDFGQRRIGLALSDASGTLASPARTLHRGHGDDPVALVLRALDELAAGEPIVRIVVGLPRRLDGSDTTATAPVRVFVAELGARAGLPVELQDERLTSCEAEARLALRERDWRKRKDRIDAAAAAILLQDWLDERRAASSDH
jgi:putative Holliday junction resolvase